MRENSFIALLDACHRVLSIGVACIYGYFYSYILFHNFNRGAIKRVYVYDYMHQLVFEKIY